MSSTTELSPTELKGLLDEGATPTVLDVREDEERAAAVIATPSAVPHLHWPLSRFMEAFTPDALPARDPSRIVVYCHHGVRSRRVAEWLRSQGFDNVFNLTGGIDAWSQEVDPSVPRY